MQMVSLLRTYAYVCDRALGRLSKRLEQKAGSLQKDFNRAAIPMLFQEYISMTIFTSILIGIETFFLFSSAMYVMSAPMWFPPENITANVSEEIFLPPASYSFGTNYYAITNTTQPIWVAAPQNVSCMISFFPEGVENAPNFFMDYVNGQWEYQYTPNTTGLVEYWIACNDSTRYAGRIHAVEQLLTLSGTVSRSDATITTVDINGHTETAAAIPGYSLGLPPGEYTVTASYHGARSSQPIVIEAASTRADFNLTLIQLNITPNPNDIAGVATFNGPETFVQQFSGPFSVEVGKGVWQYELSSSGRANATGFFDTANLTEISPVLLKTAKLQVYFAEPVYNYQDFYIYINMTDNNGVPIQDYRLEADLNGAPFGVIDSHSAYLTLNGSEDVEVLTVRANKGGYAEAVSTTNVQLKFNVPVSIMFTNMLSLVVGMLMSVVMLFVFLYYPSERISSRRDKIDANLSFALSHFSAISESGIPPAKGIELMAKHGAYNDIRIEFQRVMHYMMLLGYDLITALRRTAADCPSKKLGQVFDSFASTIHSGGDTSEFLKERAKEASLEQAIQYRSRTSSLLVIGELYIIIFIAAPIFLTVMLITMEFISPGAFGISPILLLKFGAYLFIPAMTAFFIFYISKEVNVGA